MAMRKYIALFFLLSGILLAGSCRKDFEEINKNPNGFTTASDGSLFNAIIASLNPGFNERLYVNVSALTRETQQAALPQVRWVNYTIGTEEMWANYYRSLPNFRELESRFATYDTTAAVNNMRAMEKILLAYKTFKMTDLFGDIPFFNAGYGYQSVTQLRPAFDSQAQIYHYLLNELEWASESINPSANNTEPFVTFSRFDNLFNGDLVKWRKFANSLRLRYAMRMVNSDPTGAGDIIRDIIVNARPTFGVDEFGFLVNNPYTESACLFPYSLGYRNEGKGWSYNQSKDMRMGTTMWHQLSAHDSSDGSGIYDPRAYYFFETNNANRWVPFPNDVSLGLLPDGGIPYEYQRDVAYSLKGADCNFSPVNYYLIRDMDYVPEVLITGAEVLFIRAEAYQRGIGVGQDLGLAGTDFLNGIQFSLNFWKNIMEDSKLPTGTPFNTNITVPSNVNFLSLQNNLDYFTATPSGQLDEIYEQCWIDLFLQPQEAFSLARRTGRTPREGSTPLQIYRLPIPPTEVSYNQINWSNAFGGSDQLTTRVWWMN